MTRFILSMHVDEPLNLQFPRGHCGKQTSLPSSHKAAAYKLWCSVHRVSLHTKGFRRTEERVEMTAVP